MTIGSANSATVRIIRQDQTTGMVSVECPECGARIHELENVAAAYAIGKCPSCGIDISARLRGLIEAAEAEREHRPDTLDIELRNLATSRRQLAAHAAELKARRDAFDIENAELVEMVKAENAAADRSVETIRALALGLFKATADKHPSKAVTIYPVETVENIPEGDALDWAIVHRQAIKLDEGALKRIILATIPTLRPAWAAVKSGFGVRIASDIEKALGLSGGGDNVGS